MCRRLPNWARPEARPPSIEYLILPVRDLDVRAIDRCKSESSQSQPRSLRAALAILRALPKAANFEHAETSPMHLGFTVNSRKAG
jgi:hypothetical protein